MEITLIERTTIKLDSKCDDMSLESLVNSINSLYDYTGADSVKRMGISQTFDSLEIESINGKDVMIDNVDGQELISIVSGRPVIIDGELLNYNEDK